MTENRRLFNVDEANATLPLVSKIVEDLVRLYPQWREAVGRYELAQDAPPVLKETEESRVAREEAGRLAGEIESCREELEQVGCLFRGFDPGLIDFPAMREGREVVLCWQRGESSVEFWHDLEAGFSGRQPIDAAFYAQEAG